MIKILFVITSLCFAGTHSTDMESVFAENETRALQIVTELKAKLVQANLLDQERTGLADDQAIRLTLRLCAEALSEAQEEMIGLNASAHTIADIRYLIESVQSVIQVDLNYPHIYFQNKRDAITEELKEFPKMIERLIARIQELPMSLDQILAEALKNPLQISEALRSQAGEISEGEKRLRLLNSEIKKAEEKHTQTLTTSAALLKKVELLSPEVISQQILQKAYALISGGQTSARIEVATTSEEIKDLQIKIDDLNKKLNADFIQRTNQLKLKWKSILNERGLDHTLNIQFHFLAYKVRSTKFGLRANLIIKKNVTFMGQSLEEQQTLTDFLLNDQSLDDYLNNHMTSMLALALRKYDPKIAGQRLSEMIHRGLCEVLLSQTQ